MFFHQTATGRLFIQFEHLENPADCNYRPFARKANPHTTANCLVNAWRRARLSGRDLNFANRIPTFRIPARNGQTHGGLLVGRTDNRHRQPVPPHLDGFGSSQ